MKTMKLTYTTLTLLLTLAASSYSSYTHAENHRRPSWSEGMPQREKAMQKPKFSTDNSLDIELEREFTITVDAVATPEPAVEAKQPESTQNIAEKMTTPANQSTNKVAKTETPVKKALVIQTTQQPIASINPSNHPLTTPVTVPKAQKPKKTAVKDLAKATTVTQTKQIQAGYAQTNNSLPAIKLISKVPPVYPARAKKMKKEGWVDLEIVISPQGQVQSSKIISTESNYNGFIRAAQQAVRQWKFDVSKANMSNNEITSKVRVNFTLPKS